MLERNLFKTSTTERFGVNEKQSVPGEGMNAGDNDRRDYNLEECNGWCSISAGGCLGDYIIKSHSSD